MRLRLLSFNIHKGFDSQGAKVTIHKIKEALKDSTCDLAFLQEIVGENTKNENSLDSWPIGCQCQYLANGTWKDSAYARNATYPEGHHGNAVLSHFPLTQWGKKDISTNRWEKRGVLYTQINLGDGMKNLHAYCLHLNLLHRGRKKQYRAISEMIEDILKTDSPVVVAGDFNDWNQKSQDVFEKELGMIEVFKTLNGRYAKTFPSIRPILPLDRIYVKNLRVLSAEILNEDKWRHLSDHMGIMVELEL